MITYLKPCFEGSISFPLYYLLFSLNKRSRWGKDRTLSVTHYPSKLLTVVPRCPRCSKLLVTGASVPWQSNCRQHPAYLERPPGCFQPWEGPLRVGHGMHGLQGWGCKPRVFELSVPASSWWLKGQMEPGGFSRYLWSTEKKTRSYWWTNLLFLKTPCQIFSKPNSL